MKEKLFERIFEEHKKLFSNCDVEHERFAVCFSGVPASGKTFIAKRIEKRFSGIRFSVDDLRGIVLGFVDEYDLVEEGLEVCRQIFGSSDLEQIQLKQGFSENSFKVEAMVREYMNWFYPNYSFDNGLFIWDGSVDRTHEVIFPVLKKFGFRIFVIRMPFDEELFTQREKVRNGDALFFMKNLKRWKRAYERFDEKVDFVFDGDVEVLLGNLGKKLDS